MLEVDKANQRIAVGVKQISVDPWDKIDELYKGGDLVSGNVTKLASFGALSASSMTLMVSCISRRSAKTAWKRSERAQGRSGSECPRHQD